MLKHTIGGFNMTAYLMDKFVLTEDGAKNVLKAAFLHFLSLIISMVPFILLMYFSQYILEGGIQVSMTFFIAWLAGILLVMEIVNVIEYNATFTTTYTECQKLRLHLCDVIKQLPLSYYNKHDYTKVSQTLSEDTSAVEMLLSHMLPQMIGLVPFLVLMLVMLIVNQPILGSAIAIIVAASFGCAIFSGAFQKRINAEYFEQTSSNAAAFQSAIDMQKEIRSFNLSDTIQKRIEDQLNQTEKMHFKLEMQQAIFVVTPNALLDITLGLVIFLGAGLVARGEMSILYLIGYILAAGQIANAVKQPIMDIAFMYYLDARVKRFKELQDAIEPQKKDGTFSDWDVEFKDVDFSYNPDRSILSSLNLKAKQGEITALVGPSGCGKTTVLRLLAKLYNANSGEILVGDQKISDISPESLYEQISIVFQDVILFNGTVYDNIALGRPDATADEIYEASRLAGCDEFIQNLPEKYDTLVGENGSSLSGGERQRISIARAFLKDAPIILLDEITSNLDIENEKKIQDSLDTLTKDKTTLIVSHRMKSVQNVNKIVVMDQGGVLAEGTHAELLETCPLYKEMIEKSSLTESFEY